MESQTTRPAELPVIRFFSKNLSPQSETWASTARQVRQALEEYGCFIIIYDEAISSCLNDEIYRSFEDLFDPPSETKKESICEWSDQPSRDIYSNNPNHEGIGLGDLTNIEVAQSLTNQLWPQGNLLFCESVNKISNIMMELDRMVVRMVFHEYGVDKYYQDHIGSIDFVTSTQKYKTIEKNEEEYLGFLGHTDKSFSSILHQNGVDGLEIQTKDGLWIAFVPPSRSSFLYLGGDAIAVWSNKRIRACHHRVRMRGSNTRISVGLFTFHKGVIKVPEELIDDEHPLLYKPFDHYEFLKKFKELAKKNIWSTIEDHYGV